MTDPEWINKKQINEPGNELQEAPASVTYSLLTPKGFPVLYTVRAMSGSELLAKMTAIEERLVTDGFKAQERGYKSGFTKPEPTLANYKCPQCGSDVLSQTTKTGKKNETCSKRVYDFSTKQTTGCSYIKWL